jgi:hypothetical protein
MNTHINHQSSSRHHQDNFVSVRSSNGNGGICGNGKHPQTVHLERFGHYSACGKDLIFFRGMTATSRVKEVSCQTCLKAHQKLVDLKWAARAWRREHNTPQSRVIIKRPAELGPSGLADLETAFQRALKKAEAASHA